MTSFAPTLKWLIAAALSLAAGLGDDAWAAADPAELCKQAVRKAAAAERLPSQLLEAISVVESGRSARGGQAIRAWPWTVYAEGKGRYFADKASAVQAVEALRGRGVGNIDVGCMQVNLGYHGKAFASVAAALDPDENARYAASLLRRLQRETRSWGLAVAYYHSRTPTFNRPYRVKVWRNWNRLRREAATARRAEIRAAWLAKREARRRGG